MYITRTIQQPHRYGALTWFRSYLQPRGFKVCINGSNSHTREITFSVPQGSIMGAPLYSQYASTIKKVIPEKTDVHGYADDHAIKKEYEVSDITYTEPEAITSIKNTLPEIKTWMDLNRLQMNDSKTEFIVFGSKRHLKKVTINTINVNKCDIKKSSVIRYLGVLLDESLNLKEFIKAKCKTANFHLYLLRRIHQYLTIDSAKIVALGMVISHLDYANSILIGLPKTEIQKLQRIQNMTAKVVLKKQIHSSSTEALKELHWLPIHLRIKYKICSIMYNCRQGNAPEYLKSLLTKRNAKRSGLRSHNDTDYDIPICKNKTFADRSFSVQGPKLWNELPKSLKTATSVDVFKKELKTHLFYQF